MVGLETGGELAVLSRESPIYDCTGFPPFRQRGRDGMCLTLIMLRRVYLAMWRRKAASKSLTLGRKEGRGREPGPSLDCSLRLKAGKKLRREGAISPAPQVMSIQL